MWDGGYLYVSCFVQFHHVFERFQNPPAQWPYSRLRSPDCGFRVTLDRIIGASGYPIISLTTIPS